jgi:hypothetical protein
MLLYVVVAVPLSVSFAIEIDLWSTHFFIDMVVVRVAGSLGWLCNPVCTNRH